MERDDQNLIYFLSLFIKEPKNNGHDVGVILSEIEKLEKGQVSSL